MVYSSLKDFFRNSQHLKEDVDALRKYDPAIIGLDNKWIGKKGSKAVLVAWLDRIELLNHIYPIEDREEIIGLLTESFPGLSISRRTLYHAPKADTDTMLKTFFLATIPH